MGGLGLACVWTFGCLTKYDMLTSIGTLENKHKCMRATLLRLPQRKI